MCALHGRDECGVAEVGRVRGIAPKSVSKVVRMCRQSHTLHGHGNHPTRDRSLPEQNHFDFTNGRIIIWVRARS
jgi:hypothetical protein